MAKGDWAAMAMWDLLTPSTSQGACGNVDEGDFVGGGHGCVGHPQPGLDPLPKL